MRKKSFALSIALVGAVGFAAWAGPGPDNDELVINGEIKVVTDLATPAGHPLDHLYSGWRFRSDETQRLETDDFENPAMVAVAYGEDLWETPAGSSNKSCADCHGDVSNMAGVRAIMPMWSWEDNKPLTLEQWINRSITKHQGADPWKWESPEMLAMTALIGMQSRGMPMNPEVSERTKPWIEEGRKLYYTRVGQLDMACSNCHEDHYGDMIRADHLSQGNINGFPTYRFKWQGLGSLHRRFKGCMKNIRAQPYKPGSEEFVALEIYLASRGAGLGIETPAVRN